MVQPRPELRLSGKALGAFSLPDLLHLSASPLGESWPLPGGEPHCWQWSTEQRWGWSSPGACAPSGRFFLHALPTNSSIPDLPASSPGNVYLPSSSSLHPSCFSQTPASCSFSETQTLLRLTACALSPVRSRAQGRWGCLGESSTLCYCSLSSNDICIRGSPRLLPGLSTH